MHHYKSEAVGGGSPKTGKNPAKPKFNKKESSIAKEEERKISKVGKNSCTPAGCEK